MIHNGLSVYEAGRERLCQMLRWNSDTTHGHRARQPRPSPDVSPTKTHTIWLTSAVDFRDHAVTDTDFEAGLVAGQGAYQAICSDTVYVCPMVTPPGLPCRTCDDYHAQQVAEQVAELRRHNRWWRRAAHLAHRVRRG